MTSDAPPLSRPLDRARPVVAFGVALLATAVVISTSYTRARDDLDVSNFLVGVLATAGLLAVAAASYAQARASDPATDLVTWPGAFGAIGVGLMVGVAFDNDIGIYLGGLAVVALAVLGFSLTRRGPFMVAAILGLFVVYLQLVDDLVGADDLGDELPAIKIAFALTLFAVLATVATWTQPDARVLGGAVAGGLTVVGFAVLTGVLAINNAFSLAFSQVGEFDADFVGGDPVPDNPVPDGVTDDGWTILVLALLVMLAWCACAALTGHVVFRILVVAMAVSVTPLVMEVLTVEHPTWWGVVLAAVGGAALATVALPLVQDRRS